MALASGGAFLYTVHVRSPVLLSLMLAFAAAFLPGCASSRAERIEAALIADEPPPDFTLAVTVLRPVPLGALINARTQDASRPTVQRPARYIVEADAVLRVAVGYGATEKTFPPETRQLTASQFAGLWRQLKNSPLVDPDHPCRTGKPPPLEEFARETEGRGGYAVAFCIAGEHRILAIDEASPAAKDARELVAQLLALAWVPQEEPAAAESATEPAP